MRILHIDSEIRYGGGQRQLIFLLAHLQSQGVDQALALRSGSAAEERASALGVDVFPLRQRNDLDILSAIELKKIIKRFVPDIVHTHTGRSLAVAALARRYLRVRREPFVNTRRVAFPLQGRFATRKYLTGADYHIAISRACAAQLVDIGVPPEQVPIIPSGVEIPDTVDRPSARKALLDLTGFEDSSLIVGACGNLLPVKRFDWLVNAVAMIRASHPNLRAVIFGEGRQREVLTSLIDQSQLGNSVRLLGHRDRPESLFAGLDIFAMPSKLEGLGTSLIDAMARGVALIGSDTSGIRDVIVPEENGLLFERSSIESLAQSLSRLAADVALRQRLGRAGPAIAQKRFSARTTNERILQLYRSIASKP